MDQLAKWDEKLSRMTICPTLKNVSGVYLLECKGVFYVGSSVNLYRRLFDHFKFLATNKHSNSHIQNYFNKYGGYSFSVSILEFCEKDELKDIESRYIEELDCFKSGFNQSKNSYSPLGYKHTEENKKKMSEMKKGVIHSEEVIEKRRQSLLGKQRTEEHKENYRKSKLGDKNPMFGKKYTEEQKKEKVSKLLSVPRWNTGLTKENSETLRKMSEARLGKPPANCIKCKLINLETLEFIEANSLKELSLKSELSLASINRLKSVKASENIN